MCSCCRSLKTTAGAGATWLQQQVGGVGWRVWLEWWEGVCVCVVCQHNHVDIMRQWLGVWKEWAHNCSCPANLCCLVA